MEKQIYYVSLETGDILYEKIDEQQQYFEIEASDEEVNDLKIRMRELSNLDLKLTWKDLFLLPYHNEKYDRDNDHYTNKLQNILREIKLLGTDETQQKFYEMGRQNDTKYNDTPFS